MRRQSSVSLESWLARVRSALGTRLRAIPIFIFLHAKASGGHPARAGCGCATFFEEFCPAGLFFSNQQIPRLCRTLAGDSRAGRFAAELFNFIKKGAALYQHLKRVGNEMKSNICSVNSFSNDRVRILFAENAFRICRCRSSDFTGVECMKHR